MSAEAQPHRQTPPPFRTTLVRVLIVQAVALALLGLIQVMYNA